MLHPIDAKVKLLAELGLTNTEKVRKALVDALVQNANRYPKFVLQEKFDELLNDFYNGNTEYRKEN